MTQKDKLRWNYKDSLRDMTSKYNQTIDIIGNISQNDSIVSPNSGFSEVQEWEDGNPDNENREGYFVSLYKTNEGIRLRKATSTSFIRGVSVSTPAFSSGEFSTMRDESGNLLPRFTHVVFAGIVSVIDDGTCVEGGYCLSGDEGIAVSTENPYGYKVVSRIDETHIYILVSPQTYEFTKLYENFNKCAPKVYIQDEEPTADKWIWIKPVKVISEEPDNPDEPEEPDNPEEPEDTSDIEPLLLTEDIENAEFLMESEEVRRGVLNIVDSESELSETNYMIEYLE